MVQGDVCLGSGSVGEIGCTVWVQGNVCLESGSRCPGFVYRFAMPGGGCSFVEGPKGDRL